MKPNQPPSPHFGAIPRRDFLKTMASAGAAGLLMPSMVQAESASDYRGPNVVIIRFGGGVRRRETIDPQYTYAPFLCHELTRRGTLFKNMEISASLEGEGEDSQGKKVKIETSHGQGTLYILTGKYERHRDIQRQFLKERFESKVPTVFEYFRRQFHVPEHETLIVNGEDRTNEEFYTFSNHHLFGVNFRSNVLSLYRYKTYLLHRQIEEGHWSGRDLEKKEKELAKLEAVDYRQTKPGQASEIVKFWDQWRSHYGASGLINPRGDQLLTELAIRALRQLRPRLLMINYNDPDYVHWGNLTHYTRGIAVIDQGLQALVNAVEADPGYRDNTVFVVVPDCGRDTNPLAAVPCQHHFGTPSAYQIFALLFGPGVPRGKVVERTVDQISMAATVGALMGFKTPLAEGPVLEEAFA
jgi:hypothetical protein